MAINLIEVIQRYITPDVIQRASTFSGENPTNTQRALGFTVPSILAGLMNRFSSSAGPGELEGMIEDRSRDASSILENPAAAFTGGPESRSVMNEGQGILSTLFGSRTSSIANTIANASGIRASSATSLLGFAAPLVMSAIARIHTTEGLDRTGLASLLAGQRDSIMRMAPPGLAAALGLGGMPTPPDAGARSRIPVETGAPIRRSGTPGWLWALAAVVILAGLIGLLSRGHRNENRGEAERSSMATVNLPNGKRIDLPVTSLNYALAKYLGDKNDTNVPRSFTFDNLNFETGGTNLTPESKPTVDHLAEIMNAYPNAQVRLEGHTDNIGTPEANRRLSQDRANAVKSMLEERGVDGSRMTTMGYGPDKPTASNETGDGRAANRRTELAVVRK